MTHTCTISPVPRESRSARSVKMKDLAGEWIEKAVSNEGDPMIKEFLSAIQQLYKDRLWHQLTVKIEEFCSLPQLENRKDALIDMLNNFIKHFSQRLSPLRYSQMVVKIASLSAEPLPIVQQALDAVEHFSHSEEAQILLRCTVARYVLLVESDQKKCRDLLEAQEPKLKALLQPDPSLYATYYGSFAEYHKSREEAAEFYHAGLKYLAYMPLEDISIERRRALSADLCLSALIGDSVYNFGELLANPVLESLEGTETSFLRDLVTVFNQGDILKYESLVNRYSSQLEKMPGLVKNRNALKKKISVLSLMEMVFERKADDRILTFEEIGAATKLRSNDAELLVMKAMSLGLVRGSIDEVLGHVVFTWVQPRVIDTAQLAKMKERLHLWAEKVDSTASYIEKETPDLFK